MRITTRRLILVPASAELAGAEIHNRPKLAELLGVKVPEAWPPETMRDAMPWFYAQLTGKPVPYGWFYWYGLLAGEGAPPLLVSSIGFKGEPDAEGTVEIGYSVLERYQGRGIACEMVGGLCEWAFSDCRVRRVIAQTEPENRASVAVLLKNGFAMTGPGHDHGMTQFALPRPPL